jgi:ATP-dependent Lon protease
MSEPAHAYPSELPVLALRDTVVFPLTLQPLAVSRPHSVEAVNRALAGDRLLFLALQTTDRDDTEPGDLKSVGTIAAIRQMAKAPGGAMHIIVEGLTRARSELVTKVGVGLRATVTTTPETGERTLEVDAYVRRLRELIDRALSVSSRLSQELRGRSPASTIRCAWPTCSPASSI